MADKMAHFVIAGGGTAGWLSALILQKSLERQKLEARVTVVESSKIPTIGVGEGSTAVFRVLLQYFGLDEFAFLRETGGTLKLGIRHKDWREKGFVYDGPIDDPHQVVALPKGADRDFLNLFCTAAGRRVEDIHMFGALLKENRAPYALKEDGSLLPLGPFHYAYHFDQARVGAFLRKHAEGVEIVDATIAGVEKNAETGDIKALLFEDGTQLEGDFFIDATGFKRRLIGEEMGVAWTSYAHELPVNRAMPFWINHDDKEDIAIHTLAQAMDAGWMWKIPTQERYGCGYVYCDQFQDQDGAKRELEALLGYEIEVRNDIRFETGRLQTAWAHNCMAVGLSSVFLEPLEATSIHGTAVQVMLFAGRYLKHPNLMTPSDRDDFNHRVARQVNDFRSFINLHYMGARSDTPFWREMRENRVHKETKHRLALWAREMPRQSHFDNFLDGLPHVETQLYYPVLDGLGLLDKELARKELASIDGLRRQARQTADSLTREYRLASVKALSHREFLQFVNDRG